MKTIVLKMQHQNKNALDELSSRMNMTQERIRKLEDRTIEISQSNSRVNRLQKNQTKPKPKNQLAKPEEPMGEKKLAEP